MPTTTLFAYRPDPARRLIRQAMAEFDNARSCDAGREYPGGHGLLVPADITAVWRRQSLRNAREYRHMARRAIVDAWPAEWQHARLMAQVPWRNQGERRAAA